jgi:spermidine synthase
MLMIGGGGGTLPRQYNLHYECKVDVAEIDPKVVEVSREWFYLQPHEDLRLHVEDGRMFLKLTDRHYDVILIDAFTGGGHIPFHLITREFFEEVRRHLAPGGVVAMNVINALDGPGGQLYRAIHKTLRAAGYANVYVFPKYRNVLVRNESHNLIIIATMDEQRLGKQQVEHRALDLYQTGPVRISDFVMHARHYLPDESNRTFDDAPVLTDNYAPVELMVAE